MQSSVKAQRGSFLWRDNKAFDGVEGTIHTIEDNDLRGLSYVDLKEVHRDVAVVSSVDAEVVKGTDVEDTDNGGEERQQWSNPIEFLLSCIAMSVGLGNVWRFPITAYKNGGGAFLIPYLTVLIFIGRPLYFLELGLGQFSSFGCVKMWKVVPAAKGIGYGQVVATAGVLTYYVSLMALTIFYFVCSFQAELPWSVCDPAWVGDTPCVPVVKSNISLHSNDTKGGVSSAELFFKKFVTHEAETWEAGLGMPDWKLTLCLAGAWLVLFLTLVKGVQSAGKAAYFTALFPYVVLFTLLGRGATLPGAIDGIMYFITPQWEKLLEPKVWYEAVAQSFFSLSVAFGSIQMFSSYNDFRHNIYRDAWIISFMDTGTSFLAGLTIFSILGNLKYEIQAETFDEVVSKGTGLAFVTYPSAIAKLDYVPQLFAVLFFLMLFTLGLGSASALTNCVITVICDQWPRWSKALVTAVVCIIGFLLGLIYVTPEGMWILEVVDYFGGGMLVFILAVLESFFISWVYGLKNILQDFKFMLGVNLGWYWKICWGFIVPGGLTAILVYSFVNFKFPTYNDFDLPVIAQVCGVLILAGSLAIVIGSAVHSYWIADCPIGSSRWQRIKFILNPKETWGPKKPKLRSEWLISRASTSK